MRAARRSRSRSPTPATARCRSARTTTSSRPPRRSRSTAPRPAVGGSTFRPAPRSASSPARPARCTIYVIDVAAGDKIPRKGGPGITRSDLLVINKTDLAPLVVADLGVMARDARRMRGERPFVFTNIRSGEGVATVADFITMMGGLAAPAP